MTLPLATFEKIDGLYSRVLYMGDFLTCADPRAWIAASNRLFDACVDAIGFAAADAFASAEECAATIITRELVSA